MRFNLYNVLFTLLFYHGCIAPHPYMTYNLSGGRLGDNLVSYANAKWLAYKYNLTLLYKSFPYSDKFKLHYLEKPLAAQPQKLKTIIISSVPPAGGFREDTFYIVPYFTECIKKLDHLMSKNPFSPDWTDQPFLQLIRSAIAPHSTASIQLTLPQPDKISIAVHARVGSGRDRMSDDNGPHVPGIQYSDVGLPGNHPPESYYLTCIRSLVDLFPTETPFYIHIFTDSATPQEIVTRYQRAFAGQNITFGYCPGKERHELNVLDDLFSMAQFPYLIMPASNLSFIASKLGNFKIVMEPAQLIVQDNKTVVGKVKWTVHQKGTYVLPLGKSIDATEIAHF